MNRSEWNQRFANRFHKISQHPMGFCLKTAKAATESFTDNEEPEESAEVEYGYWTNDDPLK